MSTAVRVERVEGVRVGTTAVDEPELCDTCGDEIRVGDAVAVFFTSTPFIDEFETPYPFRLHCASCETDSLFWSPRGYGELLVVARLVEGKVIRDVLLKDFSGVPDGSPYDPVSVFAELVDLPESFVEREIIPSEDLIGPQDFIYYMFLNGMDPRDAVDMETGKVTACAVDQTKFFETVFMQFKDGLAGSIGSHYDEALDENDNLRDSVALPGQ